MTIRGAVAAGLALATAWVLARQAADAWPGSGAHPEVEDVVGGVLALVAAGLAAWLGASCALAVLAALPGTLGETFAALNRALAPHVIRRALSLGIGASVGLVALPAPAAVATSADMPGDIGDAGEVSGPIAGHGNPERPVRAPAPAYLPTTTEQAAAVTLESATEEMPLPGWVPDRPTRQASPEQAQLLGPALRPAATAVETVTVRRGDTLWSIAARHLGAGATESEIAAEWPRWYSSNRAAIGQDPDLIRPGQQLVAPAAEMPR